MKICDITTGSTLPSPVQGEHRSYRIDRKATIIDITLATPSVLDYDMDNHGQLDVLSSLVETIRKSLCLCIKYITSNIFQVADSIVLSRFNILVYLSPSQFFFMVSLVSANQHWSGKLAAIGKERAI